MNERLIYEWLRPELKGKDWDKQDFGEWGGWGYGWVAAGDSEWKDFGPLPPLDMNTWHGEVVPKLQGEGCAVEFAAEAEPTEAKYWVIWRDRVPFSMADPYEALTEYLEAK